MEPTDKTPARRSQADRAHGDTLTRVSQALDRLRFGEIRIVVHEGRVVLVERTEKLRLSASDSAP